MAREMEATKKILVEQVNKIEVQIPRKTGAELEMEEIADGEKVTFNVTGRVDVASAMTFSEVLNEAVEKYNFIVLDMGKVYVLTSIGIMTVLKTFKTAQKKGGSFQITNPSEQVRNVLALSALGKTLLVE
jgi:anti-anti-sigma factor